MDNTELNSKESQLLNEKLDSMLEFLTNFRKKLEADTQKQDKQTFENQNNFNLLINKFESITNHFDKKFSDIDKKFEAIDKRFEAIDRKFDAIDKRFEAIDSKISKLDSDIIKLCMSNQEEHKKLFENIDRIDRRITALKSSNEEEHRNFSKHLDSINSAFIRYETDGTDKIRILFDSDIDRKNHQDIYGHEFKRLNDLIAKNSFRISNLEQHFNQN